MMLRELIDKYIGTDVSIRTHREAEPACRVRLNTIDMCSDFDYLFNEKCEGDYTLTLTKDLLVSMNIEPSNYNLGIYVMLHEIGHMVQYRKEFNRDLKAYDDYRWIEHANYEEAVSKLDRSRIDYHKKRVDLYKNKGTEKYADEFAITHIREALSIEEEVA
jgi:hypothetical protein